MGRARGREPGRALRAGASSSVGLWPVSLLRPQRHPEPRSGAHSGLTTGSPLAARVKHPNILQLVDVFVTRKEYFIFLEL